MDRGTVRNMYFYSKNKFEKLLHLFVFTAGPNWPRGLRPRSTAARLLRLWVRIPPEACLSVCCECIVMSGRCLCDGLITRPEESYRLLCVVVCDLGTSRKTRPWPALGRSATGLGGGEEGSWLYYKMKLNDFSEMSRCIQKLHFLLKTDQLTLSQFSVR